MTAKEFNIVVEEQLERCKDILCVKADEYADKANDDRLHNFKCASGLMNCDPKEALMGMMVKHTVSVADMCRSGKNYDIDLWNEKITDSINYLLLLKGLVVERYVEANKKMEAVRRDLEEAQMETCQTRQTDELLKSAPMETYPASSPEFVPMYGTSTDNPIPNKYAVTISMNQAKDVRKKY